MSSRRLLGALACATALFLIPTAAAQAAPTGVNVSELSNEGDVFVNDPNNAADVAQAWRDVQDSGSKQVRTFVQWNNLQGSTLDFELDRMTKFVGKARARGLQVVLVVTGHAGTMATPSAYAGAVAALAHRLSGQVTAYEVWNEEDESGFWLNGPQPGAYAALLKAAYPAIKAEDPNAAVIVGGLVGNDFDYLSALYDNGAKGSFDGVGVHTDTACLSTDPREFYREPSGRIGRYSFTGYREVRATMLAHGDDKPVYMTELGWSTTSGTCARGGRAGTKEAGVSQAVQADFLGKAYGCLANDPYVVNATWFNLHDLDTGSGDDSLNLGLVTDTFARKPAFAAMQRAAHATAIPCGGVLDQGAPTVTLASPTDGAQYLTSLPIDIRANDNQGVNDIDLVVDGKQVPLKTVKSGTGASVKFEWGGAKNLSYGPHQVVAIARDEAKNEGRATAKVIHVGGGKYPYAVKTSYELKVVGKVKAGKVKVRGKIHPKGNLSRLAHGRAYVFFSRFDTKTKRWKRYSRFSRDAKHAFTLSYSFKKRGVWRVTGNFKPKKGFKASRSKAFKLKVR
jgi:hypothetical protein